MKRSLSGLLGLAMLAPASATAQKQRFSSLDEALATSGILAGSNGPASVNWIDNGARFSYIARDPANGHSTIRSIDAATGRDALLFDGSGLTFPGTGTPFEYASFQWSRDSRHLVFRSNLAQINRNSATADFYIYSLADRGLKLATKGARTGELSPDGTMLGFERGGDMYVTDLAHASERRLTSDATEHVYNGHFDWDYEEEFGMVQAWRWSPDSRHIAYWQLDDSKEPVTQLSDLSGVHPEWEQLRVPLAGDPNASVRIGIVDVASGTKRWLDLGIQGDYYIPRIYWTSSPDTLAVVTLNRHQNKLGLYFFDVNTGGRKLVLSDSSKTWLDVYDFYAGIDDMFAFPAGSREFFYISDRDGWQHVYRYDYAGKLVKQVTHGNWSVTRIERIDAPHSLVYYTSTQPSPLQRQLYSVRFDGTGTRRLTDEEGTHHIDMAPDAAHYLDRWSTTEHPTRVALRSTSGAPARVLEENARTTSWLASHEYSPARTFSFTTSDSVRVDGYMIRPPAFDSTRKYPIVFSIYGGPGSQEVYDQFNTSGWLQWLAQRGYIVVGVNNRATNNYGSAFMKIVYGNLGKWEARDFAETARYLAKQPYVDAKRVAIIGTSYGAYATLFTMEQYPELFPVGIANSTVADWRFYDSIYTERYMGLPAENKAGYDASSPLVNAAKLRGHLLLIHSLMDDNVHPQNTMQLLTAFTNAGKDVDLRIYPPGRHGAAYNLASSRLIAKASDDFLTRWLPPGN